MTIIQNVACIDLICNPSDKIIKINSEILRGKKILSIFVCGVNYIGPTYNPPRPKQYLDHTLIKNLGLYMNLFDMNGNNFIKSLSSENFLIDIDNPDFVELPINRVLDFDKSNFSYKAAPTITQPAKLRIYVFYQTHNFKKFNDEVNGSITVTTNQTSYKLSDLVGKRLDGKKIKKIITSLNGGGLNLICKQNLIENIDTLFFNINTAKEFYLDDIEIDAEKSTVGNVQHNIGGSQTYNITFIY